MDIVFQEMPDPKDHKPTISFNEFDFQIRFLLVELRARLSKLELIDENDFDTIALELLCDLGHMTVGELVDMDKIMDQIKGEENE